MLDARVVVHFANGNISEQQLFFHSVLGRILDSLVPTEALSLPADECAAVNLIPA